MSDHPFIPKSNSKIVPPFIPKPKESLEAENARLKAEVERLTEIIRREVDGGVGLREEAQRTVEENHKLRAEVERLRKAGDAVSLCLEAYWKCKPYDVSMTIKCFDAWNAAKEGKPSV